VPGGATVSVQERIMLQLILAPTAEVWLPMVASLLTGAAIGLEREFKAKAAGVRTHALVCFSSAILMMAAVRQADWTFDGVPGSSIVSDPTRMAHGILTGIGFLGAGVIFRQGHAVKGLTTAASIWVTASLGVLYGAGLTMLAITGTVTALVVLVAFRVFYFLVPDRIESRIELGCDRDIDPRAVTAALGRHALRVGPLSWRRGLDGAGGTRISTTVWLRRAEDAHAVDATLRQLGGVRTIGISLADASDQLNH
jgi:putative Mg2+ transporter-C (MgtC) family protein